MTSLSDVRLDAAARRAWHEAARPAGAAPCRGTAPAGSPPGESPQLDVDQVLAKATSENFPVAARLLPARARRNLLAVYGYARFVDDLGDLAAGDRLAQLDWAESELDRALRGAATHPVFVEAGRMASECGASRRPFADLIAANRQDQRVKRYDYDGLLAYCTLSANPVGRLVLAVFGRSGPLLEQWSDAICTGLQLVEHWQDVSEDYAAGRVYLPLEDLARFGVAEADLAATSADPPFRRLMAFEAARARRLLESGRPLVAALDGHARLAVAGFLGGGLAQLAAIEASGYQVLGRTVKASSGAVARAAARELLLASPRLGAPTRRGRA